MDDSLRLETPEQIEINYDIARLGSRFIAALWDTLALVALQIMLFLAGLLVVRLLDAGGAFVGEAWIAVLILLSFILFWGYYVLFEVIWSGQTPGKRLAGIRTVRANGYPIGFVESAIRNVVRIIDFLPGNYGIGTVVMFVDRRSRRLGDFAAGTIVVHDRAALSLQKLRTPVAVDSRFLEPPLPNLHRLSLEEVEAARTFLQRRGALINADALAAQLAGRFRQQLELPEGVAYGNLELVQRVVAQYGRWTVDGGR